MGITKTEGFSTSVTEMADLMKVIGHPARLSIIQYLASTSSCICNDIVDELPLAQPTISRHLSELKRVGLIKGSFEGKNICYCINIDMWNQIRDAVLAISDVLENQSNCC